MQTEEPRTKLAIDNGSSTDGYKTDEFPLQSQPLRGSSTPGATESSGTSQGSQFSREDFCAGLLLEDETASISFTNLPKTSGTRSTAITSGRAEPCKYCGHLFSSSTALSRHIRGKHRYPCEKGCLDKRFETPRDRDRHYQSRSCSGYDGGHGQNYRCCCGKQDHRKDLHIRHLRTCRKPPNGYFQCLRCQHRTTMEANHQEHLKKCLQRKKRGQGHRLSTEDNE